jgi:type VI secretion system protein ImpF
MKDALDNLQASILDKLMDDEPEVPFESAPARQASFADIKASVIRDIENLLNTRRTVQMPAAALTAVGKSLHVYGLRDFSNENPSSSVVVQKLRREVVQTLALFEPRLRNVIVQIEQRANERNLHFRISGTLVITPLSEPVVFDTLFDANRGEYLISQ